MEKKNQHIKNINRLKQEDYDIQNCGTYCRSCNMQVAINLSIKVRKPNCNEICPYVFPEVIKKYRKQILTPASIFVLPFALRLVWIHRNITLLIDKPVL